MEVSRERRQGKGYGKKAVRLWGKEFTERFGVESLSPLMGC